jgi:hypothetical protein
VRGALALWGLVQALVSWNPMIRGSEGEYPICLLDTMAVSEMAKRPEALFRHFVEWSHDGPEFVVPCFTVYTLMELRRKRDLFRTFIEQFENYPCGMLKGYAELMDEEADSYPDPSQIEVCSLMFFRAPSGGDGNRLSNLPSILANPELIERGRQWNAAGPEIVKGMVSLVPNYPPDGGTAYTQSEVKSFELMASLAQLIDHGHRPLVERELAAGREVDLAAFPSLKAMTYTVFHKFYADRNRKPSDSDAFDVFTASALPYVEAFITENHQAEVIRKTKRRDRFLEGLEVLTLRDFRDGPP